MLLEIQTLSIDNISVLFTVPSSGTCNSKTVVTRLASNYTHLQDNKQIPVHKGVSPKGGKQSGGASPHELGAPWVCVENQHLIQIWIKIRTVQKFDIRADGFQTETACNLLFKLKVTKIALFAFSVQIKNVLKDD